MDLTLTLTDDQLDELADLVAHRLGALTAPAPAGLVDAQTVADALGVSRDWVYDHASEIGGVRAGNGDRPRWRFNVADALAAWQPAAGTPPRTPPRRRRSSNGHRNLLPVHGDEP